MLSGSLTANQVMGNIKKRIIIIIIKRDLLKPSSRIKPPVRSRGEGVAEVEGAEEREREKGDGERGGGGGELEEECTHCDSQVCVCL